MRKVLYIGILILIIACLSIVPIMYNLQDTPKSLPQAISAASEILPDDGSYVEVPKENEGNKVIKNPSKTQKAIYTGVSLGALALIGIGYLFLRRRLKKRRPKEEREKNKIAAKKSGKMPDNNTKEDAKTKTQSTSNDKQKKK